MVVLTSWFITLEQVNNRQWICLGFLTVLCMVDYPSYIKVLPSDN